MKEYRKGDKPVKCRLEISLMMTGSDWNTDLHFGESVLL